MADEKNEIDPDDVEVNIDNAQFLANYRENKRLLERLDAQLEGRTSTTHATSVPFVDVKAPATSSEPSVDKSSLQGKKATSSCTSSMTSQSQSVSKQGVPQRELIQKETKLVNESEEMTEGERYKNFLNKILEGESSSKKQKKVFQRIAQLASCSSDEQTSITPDKPGNTSVSTGTQVSPLVCEEKCTSTSSLDKRKIDTLESDITVQRKEGPPKVAQAQKDQSLNSNVSESLTSAKLDVWGNPIVDNTSRNTDLFASKGLLLSKGPVYEELRRRSLERKRRQGSASPSFEPKEYHSLDLPKARHRSMSPSFELRKGSVSPSCESRKGSVPPSFELRRGSVSQSLESRKGSVSPYFELRKGSVSPSFELRKGSVSQLREGSVSPSLELRKGSVSPSLELRKGSIPPSFELRKGSVSPSFELRKGPVSELREGSTSPTFELRKGSVPPSFELRKGSVSPSYELVKKRPDNTFSRNSVSPIPTAENSEKSPSPLPITPETSLRNVRCLQFETPSASGIPLERTFSPIMEVDEETDSPIQEDGKMKYSPMPDMKEICVPKPKDGSLYPCLKLDVSTSSDASEDLSSSISPGNSKTADEMSSETSVMKSTLHRSISSYRREQKEMRTPSKKTEEGIVVIRNIKPEEEAIDKKKAKLNTSLMILEKQAIQAEAALKSAINSQFKNEIEEFEAQSVCFHVKEQIRLCNEEMNRIKIEKTVRPKNEQFVDEGTLIIGKLNIQLDVENLEHHTNYYYVFALIYVQDTVIKTPVVCLDHSRFETDSRSFNLDEKVIIDEMYSNFDAKIQIFAVQVPKDLKKGTPSKKLKMCPKSKRAPTSSAASGTDPNFRLQMVAYAVFSLMHLNQNTFSITKTAHNMLPWSVNKPLLMDFNFIGKYILTFKDFVNVYSKSSTNLVLRWCTLDGSCMQFFNYPSEESGTPMASIALDTITSKPAPAPINMCITPHAFFFTTKNGEEENNNLLVAGSKSKMEQWIAALDFYLSLIKKDD